MVQTGLTGHAMLWPEAAATFKIPEVAPFMLEADLDAVNTKTVTANADFWKGLPEPVKAVIQEVAVDYRDHLAEMAMDRAAEAREAYAAAGGTIVKMSDEQRAAWAASMPDIAVEWVETLEGEGQPGAEMLRAYLAKLGASGAVPLRDWTAELSN